MNRITEITKRDILDLFRNGLEIDDFFETKTVPYPYFGRLEELNFLKKLYDLEDMPSNDSRYEKGYWKEFEHNRDAYTDAKTEFIKKVYLKGKEIIYGKVLTTFSLWKKNRLFGKELCYE